MLASPSSTGKNGRSAALAPRLFSSGAPPEAAVAAAGRQVQTSLVVVEHAGPAAARNAGAARAKGELLAFTDDDCQVTAGWLRAFAARVRTKLG